MTKTKIRHQLRMRDIGKPPRRLLAAFTGEDGREDAVPRDDRVYSRSTGARSFAENNRRSTKLADGESELERREEAVPPSDTGDTARNRQT